MSRDPVADAGALAARLDARLRHRGPDDGGVFASPDGTVLLAHRRLAIIDPTPAGRQPMASPDGRAWLAYNGEIYNYRALRRELEAAGERFTTASDTEVVLRLLLREGPASLERLRGMFALALWNEGDRSLLLARDRFGIKPLYVAASPARVAFASEIGALIGSGLVPRDVDAAGVLAFLRWGSVPAPLTWVRGVEALEPGTWRSWSRVRGDRRGVFADARASWSGRGRGVHDHEWHARVCGALDDSVSAHLVADVPVGVFLSSGLDSSALVALARARVPDLRTFTVVVDERAYSEAAGAEAVARHYGTTHHTLRVDARGIAGDWPAIASRMDQPTVDGVNSYYVSKAVAATGTKAVLSGLGGDELFGGYPSFRRFALVRRLARTGGPALALAARAAALGGGARAVRYRHLAAAGGEPIEIYRSLRGFLMPVEIAKAAGVLLREPASAARVDEVETRTLSPAGDETDAGTIARLESTLYMRAQLLRDVDAMSMAHSLEVRVPFVDEGLVSTVWPSAGERPALTRHKQALRRCVPDLPDAVTRMPKRGFTLPFAAWLDGPLSDLVRSGLGDLEADGWVTAGTAARVWSEWRARRLHWTKPWGLGVLGRFLRDG